MPTKIVSFGFKYGDSPIPQGADLIVDTRLFAICNPYYKFPNTKGDDKQVVEFIEKYSPSIDKIYDIIYTIASRCDSIIYVGCTGGHHRSVYIANRLGKDLGVPVEHRDYNRK